MHINHTDLNKILALHVNRNRSSIYWKLIYRRLSFFRLKLQLKQEGLFMKRKLFVFFPPFYVFYLTGDCVNNLVKYFYRVQGKDNTSSLTVLLCGETGLVSCLEQAFLHGFKSVRLFGRNLYIWDFIGEFSLWHFCFQPSKINSELSYHFVFRMLRTVPPHNFVKIFHQLSVNFSSVFKLLVNLINMNDGDWWSTVANTFYGDP